MGITNFLKDYFKPGEVVGIVGCSEFVYVDLNVFYMTFASSNTADCNLNDSITFHTFFLKHLFENVLHFELSNKSFLNLIIDNDCARKFQKWSCCIDRHNNNNAKSVFEKKPFNPEQFETLVKSNYPSLKFKLITCEYDADKFIYDNLTVLIAIEEKCKRQVFFSDGTCEEVSGLTVYSNDSDFCSFFPLKKQVAVFSLPRLNSSIHNFSGYGVKINLSLSNFKLNEHNVYIKQLKSREKLFNKKSKIYNFDFFTQTSITLIGMLSDNDYISFNLMDEGIFSVFLDYIVSERFNLDQKRVDLNFVFLYLNFWFSKKMMEKSKLKPLLNNSLRCLVMNATEPSVLQSHIEQNKKLNGQDLQEVSDSIADEDSRSERNIFSQFRFQNTAITSTTDEYVFSLKDLNELISNKQKILFFQNFEELERNFKFLQKKTTIKKINVALIIQKFCDCVIESLTKSVFSNSVRKVTKKRKVDVTNEKEDCEIQANNVSNLFAKQVVFFILKLVDIWFPFKRNEIEESAFFISWTFYVFKFFNVYSNSEEEGKINVFEKYIDFKFFLTNVLKTHF